MGIMGKFLLLGLAFLCFSSPVHSEPGYTEKEYRIAEALAEVAYYTARVRSVELLLVKAQRKLIYEDRNLERAKKLAPSKAMSQQEFDEIEHVRDQTQLNTDLLKNELAVARAELKGAEARVGIVETATAVNVVKVRRRASPSDREQDNGFVERMIECEAVASTN